MTLLGKLSLYRIFPTQTGLQSCRLCAVSFILTAKLNHHPKVFERYIPLLCTATITQSHSNLEISKFSYKLLNLLTGNFTCILLRALVLPAVTDSRNSLLELFLLHPPWMENFARAFLLLPWDSAWEWAQRLYIDLLTQASQIQAAPARSVSFSQFQEHAQDNTATAELQLSEMVHTPQW